MSKSKRIFIVRHAKSMGNVHRVVYRDLPDWKIPLTLAGCLDARSRGTALDQTIHRESIGVYISPWYRTRQTWSEMRRSLPMKQIKFVKEDPRLREQERGNLRSNEDDEERIEVERDAFGSFFYRFQNGESGADVYDRCTGFLETLHRDFRKPDHPRNTIIVTHGFTLRVLLMRWLHWSVEEFHSLANPPNCGCYELRLKPDNRYGLTTSFPKDDV